MHKVSFRRVAWFMVIWLVSMACQASSILSNATPVIQTPASAVATQPPVNTPEPTRLLTICMGREPASLFLYGDFSLAARNVRQAIYDGPFDVIGFQVLPVILAKTPSLGNGAVAFETVAVRGGDMLVDGYGNLVKLGAGVNYRPAGCNRMDCLAAYDGEEAVQTDQMVVRFELLPGLLWSDGQPLSADDSVYSYEIARSLYPQVRADLLLRTAAYQALDAATVEWRGVAGYRDPGFATNFFAPLPRHAWGGMAIRDLFSAEASARKPMGWGPYVIDEWVAGDHITLSRNANYFRRAEDLPRFDKLVLRFMPDKDQAKLALLAGECDVLDETVSFAPLDPQLAELESSGRAQIVTQAGVAWEHVDFGILPAVQLDASQNMLFQLRETRQALAMCIDRQRLVSELFGGRSVVPASFVPPAHPLLNPDVKQYTFDPGAASALLESVGWIDQDGDPGTPRLAQGVPGVADHTSLAFTLLTTTEPEKQQAAQIMQSSLAQCGVKMEINASDWQTLFAPGPDGPVFGRKFEMAQFGWEAALEPPCFLYLSGEIPGSYPEAPRGWGGANASGYSNPEYDLACQQALATIAGMPEHQAAHFQAQAILADEVPMFPLYLRAHTLAARSDLCNLNLETAAESALWNLEFFDYGPTCTN